MGIDPKALALLLKENLVEIRYEAVFSGSSPSPNRQCFGLQTVVDCVSSQQQATEARSNAP